MSWKYNNQSKEARQPVKRDRLSKNQCMVASVAPPKTASKHSLPHQVLLLLATLAAIGVVLNLNRADDPILAGSTPVHAREAARKARSSNAASPKEPGGVAPEPGRSNEGVGEAILRDYADPNKTPEHDLALVAQLMNNFTLLVKTAADRPLSANEDWSRALRGMNPSHERFLAENHIILNSRQQLVDRWGTPLFFHAVGKGRYVLRSAGPDRRLWTSDDIQRNADGSFQRGARLESR